MRKRAKKAVLSRETLLRLDAGELAKMGGGDNQPAYTITLPPSRTDCHTAVGCPTVVACV